MDSNVSPANAYITYISPTGLPRPCAYNLELLLYCTHGCKFCFSLRQAVCDKHDPEYHPKFKQWCDDYFLIKHRNERRGCGGIFFDDLNNKDADSIFAFSEDCQKAVVSHPCSNVVLLKLTLLVMKPT